MNTTLIESTQPSVGSPTLMYDDTPRPLKIFVAFDEAESARNAKVLIRHVARDDLCDTELCRIEELTRPPQNKAVVLAASTADLLIIALHGGRPLTKPLRTWLNRLPALRDSDQEGVLVMLVSSATVLPGADAELLAYLQTLAVLSRLAFFAGHAESEAENSTGFLPLAETRFTPFAMTAPAPVALRGWGINE